MTREEEIQEAAIETRCAIATSISGDNYSSIDDLPFIEGKISYDELVEKAFIKGAMWADAHPAKKQAVTIDTWVARDKDGRIFIYENKPYREENLWDGSYYIELPKKDFPPVTWENSPKKVKVTIELEEEV